jgi:hypothetical protein
MKRLIYLAMVLLLGITLVGCGGNPGGGGGNWGDPTKVAKFDISGAKALILGSAPGSSTSQLFKLTTSDQIVEINPLDVQNQPVTHIYPMTDIFETPQFLIIPYNTGDNVISTFLIKKSDGTVTNISGAGPPFLPTTFMEEKMAVQTDSAGNLYYLTTRYETNTSGDVKLVKIDIQNPSAVTHSQLSLDIDPNVFFFRVDGAGNAIYSWNSGGEHTFRIIKASGGTEKIASAPGYLPYNCIVGSDGTSYLLWSGCRCRS